jgi:Xaa-Pro aminopeptidase
MNTYPFRASSHFLYFAGIPLVNAAIRLEAGQLELFMDEAPVSATLWSGLKPSRAEIASQIGAAGHFSLAALADRAPGAATLIPTVIPADQRPAQAQLLQRPLDPEQEADGIDLAFTHALIQLRLCHDSAALDQMRQAATVSMAAHKAGIQVTAQGLREAQVRGAMEQVIMAHNMTCAYPSIVTVQGEVLHNNAYHHKLQSGDLLLADVGAETQLGWASDITRTWPVSGKFSATQRDIYDLVLLAHDTCIAQIQPGVEYQDIHLAACQVLATGLVDLGILQGNPEDLVAEDVHSLFFPHGVGHLLGLDVHDMEDLGDRAGYAPGRSRSDRFGLGYLRLNRPLEPDMVVTIEPGFYQVSALLDDPQRRDRYRDFVNWDRLATFADVRGIRIEDDVRVTETGAEVLTADLPTEIQAIEALMTSE